MFWKIRCVQYVFKLYKSFCTFHSHSYFLIFFFLWVTVWYLNFFWLYDISEKYVSIQLVLYRMILIYSLSKFMYIEISKCVAKSTPYVADKKFYILFSTGFVNFFDLWNCTLSSANYVEIPIIRIPFFINVFSVGANVYHRIEILCSFQGSFGSLTRGISMNCTSKSQKGGGKLTFFPMSLLVARKLEQVSLIVRSWWSKNVTSLTPARMMFFAISAPSPFNPINKTLASRRL